MRSSRQTEITVEVDQIITFKRRHVELDWCPNCGAEVLMVTPDEATAIAGFGSREIFRLVDGAEIHFTESSQGLVRLCLPSLLEALNALGQRARLPP